MAIHLTPTELAREAGMERREVIEKCMELGVPIFQGRIDKTLFMANVEEAGPHSDRPKKPAGPFPILQHLARRAPCARAFNSYLPLPHWGVVQTVASWM